MSAFASCRGPSPLAIGVASSPSPSPRPQPDALAALALLATPHPTARDSLPSPLAASPNNLRADTSIHAPASAALLPRGKVSLRADLGHASSPASGMGRTPTIRTHPTSESAPSSMVFSLRGEMMHAFVSTEGPEGTGLSGLVAQKIRSLSMHEKALQLPQQGWGIWNKGVFCQEEAKVFLDKGCLQDGQSWLGGLVTGLMASMVFVPILSWTEHDQGSLGGLSKLGAGGFDRVDNFLLQLLVSMVLRDEAGAALQAVLPVLVGPAAEGGGFATFPFS